MDTRLETTVAPETELTPPTEPVLALVKPEAQSGDDMTVEQRLGRMETGFGNLSRAVRQIQTHIQQQGQVPAAGPAAKPVDATPLWQKIAAVTERTALATEALGKGQAEALQRVAAATDAMTELLVVLPDAIKGADDSRAALYRIEMVLGRIETIMRPEEGEARIAAQPRRRSLVGWTLALAAVLAVFIVATGVNLEEVGNLLTERWTAYWQR